MGRLRRIAIFGATGDLTGRYLIPAFAQLIDAGELPSDVQIVALGRHDLDDESYRRTLTGALEDRAGELDPMARRALLDRIRYRRVDLSEPASVAGALPDDEPLLAYLALPPSVFEPALRALHAAGVPAGSRVVIEKPFGQDLDSARSLNRLVHQTFPEDAVYRIDHFLHHQTVQNVLGLRFANRLFEPIWRTEHVERVTIIWNETSTVGQRAGYYDHAGALRDMVQNHLLQLLTLVAMEPPISIGERDLRDRKVDVLRAVRALRPDDVREHTVRGRYGKGRIGDRVVPAYRDEPGVDPTRETETFASVELRIDNWRWAGVPFELQSGKALGEARRAIVIRFRQVRHAIFGSPADHVPNELRLELHPDRILLHVNVNGPDDPFDLEPALLETRFAPQRLSAYGRLLVDVLEGDVTLSIRDDEAEESWRIVDPIVETWRAGSPPLLEYPAGTAGPARRDP